MAGVCIPGFLKAKNDVSIGMFCKIVLGVRTIILSKHKKDGDEKKI